MATTSGCGTEAEFGLGWPAPAGLALCEVRGDAVTAPVRVEAGGERYTFTVLDAEVVTQLPATGAPELWLTAEVRGLVAMTAEVAAPLLPVRVRRPILLDDVLELGTASLEQVTSNPQGEVEFAVSVDHGLRAVGLTLPCDQVELAGAVGDRWRVGAILREISGEDADEEWGMEEEEDVEDEDESDLDWLAESVGPDTLLDATALVREGEPIVARPKPRCPDDGGPCAARLVLRPQPGAEAGVELWVSQEAGPFAMVDQRGAWARVTYEGSGAKLDGWVEAERLYRVDGLFGYGTFGCGCGCGCGFGLYRGGKVAYRGPARLRFGAQVFADEELSHPWATVAAINPFQVVWYGGSSVEVMRPADIDPCDRPPPLYVEREAVEFLEP